MKYTLAVFDFDGTLADSFPFFLSVHNRVAEQHGFKRITPDDVARLRSCGARDIMRQLELPAWKLPLVARSFIALMSQNCAAIPLFAGVGETIRQLHAAGVTLAIVSSNSYANVARILGEDVVQQIAFFECGASIFGKAARLRRVLRCSGAQAGQAIYIGDQTTDLEAARQVEMAFGAVAWGYNDGHSLLGLAPDEVFGSMADIGALAARGQAIGSC